MSNSNLICYTNLSPNCTTPRNKKIDTITIHHMAGNATIESVGKMFSDRQRQASSNYGIGSDGRIALYVDENNRSWCTSNAGNDNRAITIEVANDEYGGQWHVSDKALSSLIGLCTDICKRNGIEKINYTGDKSGNLTMHCWFVPTACPGPYLKSKFPYIADEVNKRLCSNQTAEKTNTYTVKSGDSLWAIALKYLGEGSRYKEIKELNGLTSDVIYSGQIIKLPDGNTSVNENTTHSESEPKPENDTLTEIVKVGSKVKVNKGAKAYNGVGLASFVYTREHTVSEIKGDRAVITYGGVVTAAVKVCDLTLV